MKTTRHLLIAALFTCLQTARCLAQPAYMLDPDFKPVIQRSLGARALDAAAVQADGKIVVSGRFTVVDGVPHARLARLNPDGSLDRSFNPPDTSTDLVAFVQPDQRILVYQGDVFVRLNPDGSQNSVFTAPQDEHGFDRETPFVSLPNGQILLNRGNWLDRPPLRLNADGSIDPTFKPVMDGTFLAVQSDGRMIVADNNRPIPDTSQVVRLNADGSLDPTFAPPALHTSSESLSFPPTAVVQPDGKIVVAGGFDRIGDLPRNQVARLHPNGELDLNFNPTGLLCNPWSDGSPRCRVVSLGQDANGTLHVIWVDDLEDGWWEGSLLLHWFRLNPDGTEQRHLTTFVAPPDPSRPSKLAFLGPSENPIIGFLPDGGFIIRGWRAEDMVNEPVFARIVRITPEGNVDWSFFNGLGTIEDDDEPLVLRQPGGRLLIIDEWELGGLTRLDADGTFDRHFNSPASLVVQGPFAVLPDGRFLAGLAEGANLEPHSVTFRSDGSVESRGAPLSGGGLPLGDAFRILPYYDVMLVGSAHGIQKFHQKFGPESGWQPDPDFRMVDFGTNALSGLAVDDLIPDGRILISGNFTTVWGRPMQGLARLNLNGTLDEAFNPNLGLAGEFSVDQLVQQSAGLTFVAGSLLQSGVVKSRWLKRLASVGQAAVADARFRPSSSLAFVALLAAGEDGSVFLSRGSQRGLELVKLGPDGSEDPQFRHFVAGHPGGIKSFLTEPDGSLLLSGGFHQIDGTPLARIARLKPVPGWRSSSFDAIGRFTGTIGCLAGWKYRVEASSDLKQWDPVAAGTSANESVPFSDTAPPGAARRFYRVVKE